MRRLGVLASGRGSNLRALLDATRAGPLAGVARVVVVASDRPACGALAIAMDERVPAIALPKDGRSREEWDSALAAALDPFALDLVVLAGFMRVLTPGFVARYPGRIVNIHPADTRVHRGLGGYAFALERGLSETTVTVHLVDEGLDTGPIVAQRAVDLRGATTLEEIERRGLAVEHELYPEAVRALLADTTARDQRGA